MVNFLKALPVAVLAFASLAAADVKVLRPSSSIWWVAKSLNEIAWTCDPNDNTNPGNFTVLINNSDPKILTSPIAVIAIQQRYQCTITITQDQANQPVGTGWTVLLANPLNSSDVYATSEPFEIKPLGSLYPTQVTPSGSADPGASGTISGGGSKPTSGATTNAITTGIGAVAAGVMGVFGLLV